MDSKSMRRVRNGGRYGVIKMMLGEMRGTQHSTSKRWYKRVLAKMERRYARALIRHES